MSSQEDLRVVILGAGYGTRLQRDLEAIQNKPNPFSHLNGLPKPLLPLNEKPLLNFWIDLLARENISNEKIYIVTNDNFHHKFNLWAQQHNFPLGNILSDKTLTNETRLGALSDLHLAAKHFGLEKHHLLVIAGDTLLLPSFSLNGFFSHFFEKYHHNREANGCSLICYYELSDPNEVSKRGIIELKEDGSQQVVKFLEKPKPYRPDTTSNGDCSNTTRSKLAVPPIYLYSREVFPRLEEFVCRYTTSRDQRDAPGMFIPYLLGKQQQNLKASDISENGTTTNHNNNNGSEISTNVFGFKIEGRFDVGGLDDYIACNKYFIEFDQQQRDRK